MSAPKYYDPRPRLLVDRLNFWHIPKEQEPKTAPPNDNVMIWRLPPLNRTAAGLWIPDDAQNPNIKGLLYSMGPQAMDNLLSNGIEVGHYVLFARFAGSEYRDVGAEMRNYDRASQEWLLLKGRDIMGSEDLKLQLEAGAVKYRIGDDGRYHLERHLLTGRKQKLLALAASKCNEHEAELAQHLADQIKESA